MQKKALKIMRLANFKGEMPAYQTPLASGFDVRAQLAEGVLRLGPGERAMVPTGLSFEIPPGFELQARSCGEARDHTSQYSRNDRRRLSRRSEDHLDQPRPRSGRDSRPGSHRATRALPCDSSRVRTRRRSWLVGAWSRWLRVDGCGDLKARQ